ncbi:E3 ubiquitin-protein ligase SDIR1 isoform X1 [Magnolia sinica]|uniref:E3 ubiquitin-protein ligase SDIR1 isoform X1 n=1 Tax=Magnolia sinica TaxID=86752 RepID=UPI002658A966|nr:E3 ubiquitin-protein ligase SDIR1 isoform X1 [Magnolia sinica]XP_058099316.1 E3 ubiquitin-protein ligase SDIR1 isoform X1 [Magnolia sinica]
MSFVFRGTRADLESGLPGFIPERRSVRMHAGGRPVNTNSLAFLVTAVLLLFMILNSHQMSPNFLLWLVLGVFLMATSLRMYATCQQLQAQAQAHAAAASGLLGHTEFRLHMPPSIAFATRGRLHGLRLQLALLDREFDDLDYDALRALDSDNNPSAPSMSEEDINALPVHKYKVQSHHASPSGPPRQVRRSCSIICQPACKNVCLALHPFFMMVNWQKLRDMHFLCQPKSLAFSFFLFNYLFASLGTDLPFQQREKIQKSWN